MPGQVRETIAEIEDHRRAFEDWCRSLSPEELARPVPDSTWRVQDFISHLATIDITVAEWFAAIADGGDIQSALAAQAQGDAPFDINHWNDEVVAERREWSLDEIFAEARETRAGVVEQLERLDDAMLASTIHFGGDGKRPPSDIKLADYLNGWAKHDPIHVNDMIRALPDHGNDAQVLAWLADPVIGGIARGYAASMGWKGE
jgi:hypothetical protein